MQLFLCGQIAIHQGVPLDDFDFSVLIWLSHWRKITSVKIWTYALFYFFVFLSETTENTFLKNWTFNYFKKKFRVECLQKSKKNKEGRENDRQHREEVTFRDDMELHELAPLICEHFFKQLG